MNVAFRPGQRNEWIKKDGMYQSVSESVKSTIYTTNQEATSLMQENLLFHNQTKPTKQVMQVSNIHGLCVNQTSKSNCNIRIHNKRHNHTRSW